ncbi:multidrug efflux MFS transporter MdtG [Klebsiella michiganensis]|uniref:multidrug efflux MFS transporter MdtG n=1 Tax=Klebsiella michiganensis TaxID=1134687 RepID=UPI00224E870F|nr:multidrug efflux MFS transporter MdtG [Klebsiella michiganensis]MCX3080873.1 multidrug efflux MFS transporter MdtG [Klebsiella michiganensis]MCY0819894.1 multidrug efflux MFS transporter MdtG [Klebsiella michiganensis]
MPSADTPINWKRNLTVTWLGCFLTGAAFSLVMPFLPLYVEQLGVTGHSALNMWSGLVFSITFLFSAVASPFWGGLADRKGRKIMLLRSALGMAIVMLLMGLAQNIWQFLILRALLGLLGGFIPNANALIATQIPRHKSGWALGTLSTGAVSGALLGPLADHWGLRPVFFMTAGVLFICFLFTLFLIRENFVAVSKKEMLSAKDVFTSLKNPKLVLSLFVTSLIIQVATGSIAPILTLYVRDLAGNVGNIAFISGMIASVPGIAALLSAPRLGKLGDRIGPEKILIVALVISVLLLIPMSFVQTPLQLGILRFLLGAADGALLPAVQTLLVYNSTSQISGRIFSYNQSFRDIGNVTGPLIGASVSANYGFRAVFLVTAGVVLFNAVYSTLTLGRSRATDNPGSGTHSVN